MKRISLISAATVFVLASPALADDNSPAVIHHGFSSGGVEAYETAVEVVSGDELEEIVTRQHSAGHLHDNVMTPGHLQLAASLGVSARDYTLAELTKMYIGFTDN